MPVGWQMVNRLALQTFLLTGSKHKFQGISPLFSIACFHHRTAIILAT
jgi:hypothetical protein